MMMQRNLSREASDTACCWSTCGLVRFLARHPAALRASEWLYRSRPMDWAVGLLARAVLAWNRNKRVDYERLVNSCACESPAEGAGEDLESQFLCGIMDRVSRRGKLAGFLASLEQLDFRTRTGLLRTWFHAGVLNRILRDAHVLRDRLQKPGRVRPIDAVVAPFGQCDLACRGCYAAGELGAPSASPAQFNDAIEQLKRLNVYHVLLVGKGEPFHDAQSRSALYKVVRRHPQLFFSVYSNGASILADDLRELKRLPNLIPVLSLDGPEQVNDWRRGTGVYRKVVDALRRMQDRGLLFGYISTVFRQNYDAVLDPQFVEQMAGFGCRIGYYSLFVEPGAPAGVAGSDCSDMALDGPQRDEYYRRIESLDAAAPIPLVDVDGVEARVGCRAKLGATVYVDAVTGRVSPCIRIPAEWPECNMRRPAGSGRLLEILHSQAFCDYRRDRSELHVCEAFGMAECTAAQREETARL